MMYWMNFWVLLKHIFLIIVKFFLLILLIILVSFSLLLVSAAFFFPFKIFTRYSQAILSELVTVAAVVMRYGYEKQSECLKPIDQSPTSAQFIHVSSNVPKESTPVIYASGYLDSPKTYVQPARELSSLIGAPIYLLKYRSLFQSIDHHAEDVVALANKIKKDTGQNELVLIGHSMGGLATGQAIQNLELMGFKVKKWITIASPLEGTVMANLGWGKGAENMRYSSDFLRDFSKPEVSSLHWQSDTDWIVPTKHSFPNSHIPKEVTGHLSLRENPEVLESIARFINS